MSSAAPLMDALETPALTLPATHHQTVVTAKLESVSTEAATTNPFPATAMMAMRALFLIHVKMVHAQVFLLPVMHRQPQNAPLLTVFGFTTALALAHKVHAVTHQAP